MTDEKTQQLLDKYYAWQMEEWAGLTPLQIHQRTRENVKEAILRAEQRGYERGVEDAAQAVASTPCLVDPDGPEPEEERAAHMVRKDAWEAVRSLKPQT